MIKDLKIQLTKCSSREYKKSNERFFKTGNGEYGEGDIFIGVMVPDIRKISKENLEIDFLDLQKNIESDIHEVRMCVIFILVERNKIALKSKNIKEQKQILSFYLKNLNYINNWDLVDSSAYHILGKAILNNIESKDILYVLSKSKKLWNRRVSIVTTFSFIREGDVDMTLDISERLLDDNEDLINKAVGWMLRESWKVDSQRTEYFLMKNYKRLSRTTLRYSIERMEETKRQKFLKGNFKKYF